MNKKHITHGKLKVFMILFLAVILIVLVVVCAKKIKLSQNEKNIIGTWKNSNSENVITVHDTLILYKDIPEAGLYHGNASYHFSYTDTICVTQDDISAEFCVDVDENQLIIYFAGQVYLVLQK